MSPRNPVLEMMTPGPEMSRPARSPLPPVRTFVPDRWKKMLGGGLPAARSGLVPWNEFDKKLAGVKEADRLLSGDHLFHNVLGTAILDRGHAGVVQSVSEVDDATFRHIIDTLAPRGGDLINEVEGQLAA